MCSNYNIIISVKRGSINIACMNCDNNSFISIIFFFTLQCSNSEYEKAYLLPVGTIHHELQ